jgi:hypothetical protein
MPTMYDLLMLLKRILAGIVGALLFYIALFMYEDEAGEWQSRLDNLWKAVLQRSKVTESTTVALFNKTSDMVMDGAMYIFGPRFFAFRTVMTAANISLAVPAIINLLFVTVFHGWMYFLCSILFVPVLVICGSAQIISNNKWAALATCLPSLIILLV